MRRRLFNWITFGLLLLAGGVAILLLHGHADPASLVGKPEQVVTQELGWSELRMERIPPDPAQHSLAPSPTELNAGESYAELFYSDYHGEQLYIFLVKPDIFARIKGRSPGNAALYVLEIQRYPKGAVF